MLNLLSWNLFLVLRSTLQTAWTKTNLSTNPLRINTISTNTLSLLLKMTLTGKSRSWGPHFPTRVISRMTSLMLRLNGTPAITMAQVLQWVRSKLWLLLPGLRLPLSPLRPSISTEQMILSITILDENTNGQMSLGWVSARSKTLLEPILSLNLRGILHVLTPLTETYPISSFI